MGNHCKKRVMGKACIPPSISEETVRIPLLNVAGYRKSSNTDACAQKLLQIPVKQQASAREIVGDISMPKRLLEVLRTKGT